MPCQPDRDQGNLTKTLEDLADRPVAETFGDLAGWPRPLEDLAEQPRPLKTQLRRPKDTSIWPMAGPHHEDLADGRTPLQLTLKPRSVKLIHHQGLGNATLSGIHLDKRAQQGRPTRII